MAMVAKMIASDLELVLATRPQSGNNELPRRILDDRRKVSGRRDRSYLKQEEALYRTAVGFCNVYQSWQSIGSSALEQANAYHV